MEWLDLYGRWADGFLTDEAFVALSHDIGMGEEAHAIVSRDIDATLEKIAHSGSVFHWH